jgi:branched-subunit amino acid ABC-type transport system permease component
MSWGLVLQAVVTGVAAGAVYGLVAVGFSLVYRLTRVLQLAHGELVGAASFLMIVLAFGTGVPVAGRIGAGRYALGAVVVLLGSAALSLGVYVVAVRPFRSSALGWIGGTVAVAFAIEGVLAAAFPREAYALPSPVDFGRPLGLPGGASLSPRVMYVLGVGVAVALCARVLLRRGWFASALTAIASEPDGARLVGLPVEKLLAVAFALAGVLAGVAGLMGAPDAGSIGVSTGALFGLKAIAAAILGGLVSLDRVYLTAIALGVAETCVATLPAHGAGAGWRDVAPLLLAVVFLAVRTPSAARERLG